MWFIYYIAKKSSRYYVGQTQNIEKRLERHNKSLVKSTKSGVSWDLVATIDVANRSEVLLLEKRIKKRGAPRFLNDNQFGV
jgi:putative endonuclease